MTVKGATLHSTIMVVHLCLSLYILNGIGRDLFDLLPVMSVFLHTGDSDGGMEEIEALPPARKSTCK